MIAKILMESRDNTKTTVAWQFSLGRLLGATAVFAAGLPLILPLLAITGGKPVFVTGAVVVLAATVGSLTGGWRGFALGAILSVAAMPLAWGIVALVSLWLNPLWSA